MSFFGDYKIDGTQLVAKETGARLPITPEFARDAWRILSFVWVINGLKATRIVKGREPRARISFFPKKPRSYYAIWPVCQMADVKIVDDPAEADLHFYFEDREFLTAPRQAPTDKPSFNIGCHDIRKSVITRVFEEIFGYSLKVDPTTHHGVAVEKSEANGKHDGRIINCPIDQPRRGYVYQRLIDNRYHVDDHVDIRTPIVGGQIPFVYLKHRPAEARFSNDNDLVDMVNPDTVLSKTEQEQVLQYAAALDLDFGGLDILRDRNDGRIYIVDANKTDMGPPSTLSGQDKLKAIRLLADAFATLVDRKLAG